MTLSNRRLARPYAQAAFEIAKRMESYTAWREGLSQLASLSEKEYLCWLIKDVRFSGQKVAMLILTLTENQAKKNQLSPHLQNLVRLLADRRQLLLLREIQTLFEEFYREKQKISQVFLISAVPLNQKVQITTLKTLTSQIGQSLEISYQVDPNLLGGMVIRIGEQVFDHSIKGYLSQLNQVLGHSHGI